MADLALIKTAAGLVPATEADRELRRFQSMCSLSPESGCWEWSGSKLPRGYGRFRYEGGPMGLAHRWSFERFVGVIPDGMEIDHVCRNTSCVNPDHLEAVTPEENRKRAQRFFVSKSTGTHCANGHAWNERSIYVNAKGKRFCRVCRAESMRRSRREGVKNG